jgi:hypothetical protein
MFIIGFISHINFITNYDFWNMRPFWLTKLWVPLKEYIYNIFTLFNAFSNVEGSVTAKTITNISAEP